MSILDDVRRKYKSAVSCDDPYDSNVSDTNDHLNTSPPSIQTAKRETDKTAKSPFVSYVSTYLSDLNTSDPAIRGSLEALETRSRGEVPALHGNDEVPTMRPCAHLGGRSGRDAWVSVVLQSPGRLADAWG
jgi:hypothetical protein